MDYSQVTAVNLIAPGFVDTPLSASLPAINWKRAAASRAPLPIRGVAGPADVAALVGHLMNNTALTSVIYDIDGGPQLVSGSQE